MSLKEINIIQEWQKRFPIPKGIIGIGDDCAILPFSDTQDQLVTVDALMENVHFLRSIDPGDLGYKSVMVNVSDIAAMGGETKYVFLSHGLPGDLPDAWLRDYMDGFQQACLETGVLLLGGDTVGSLKDISLSITAIGYVEKNHAKKRSAVKKGDVICVTGIVGDSAIGLRCIQNNISVEDTFLKAHTRPKAHYLEGAWLGKQEAVHGMIDISDGLLIDLKRVLEASLCGARLVYEHIPFSEKGIALCDVHHFNHDDLVLNGGEDYCLLLTISENEFEKLKKQFDQLFSFPLMPIGHVVNEPRLEILRDGQPMSYTYNPYDHFKDAHCE